MIPAEVAKAKKTIADTLQRLYELSPTFAPRAIFALHMSQELYNVLSWGNEQEKNLGGLVINGRLIPVVIKEEVATAEDKDGVRVYTSIIDIRPLPDEGAE